MRAATIHGYGGPEVLRVEDLPSPAIGPRDVLVEVRATGVLGARDQRRLALASRSLVVGRDTSIPSLGEW